MSRVWGIFVTIVSFIGWLGQAITMLSPKLAAKLGMAEPESEVDPVFAVDFRAEAAWDTFILWNLPVAGILLTINNPYWMYFGIAGGATYLYIGGRNMMQRIFMSRKKINIGPRTNIRIAYVFCSLWALSGLVTLILAVQELLTR